MAQPLRFRQVRFAPPIALLALPQRLLRLASVVNVDADAHPANDPPVGVGSGEPTSELQALTTLGPRHRIENERLAVRCEDMPPENLGRAGGSRTHSLLTSYPFR